jgi:hypothetical protein
MAFFQIQLVAAKFAIRSDSTSWSPRVARRPDRCFESLSLSPNEVPYPTPNGLSRRRPSNLVLLRSDPFRVGSCCDLYPGWHPVQRHPGLFIWGSPPGTLRGYAPLTEFLYPMRVNLDSNGSSSGGTLHLLPWETGSPSMHAGAVFPVRASEGSAQLGFLIKNHPQLECKRSSCSHSQQT